MLLAKSERAAERLLESSTKYLEKTLKLRVNRKKSRTVPESGDLGGSLAKNEQKPGCDELSEQTVVRKNKYRT